MSQSSNGVKQPGGEAEGWLMMGWDGLCYGGAVLVHAGTCFLLALHPILPLGVLWPPDPCKGGHLFQALVKGVVVFFFIFVFFSFVAWAAEWNEEPRPEKQTVTSVWGEQLSQVSNFLL